jgi:hypothetical protein
VRGQPRREACPTGRSAEVPRPRETLAAIATYCQADGEAGDEHARIDSRIDELAFDDVVAQLNGTPPLSERQARLLDALTSRLEHGPPMTPDDGVALRVVARALGFLAREP